MKLLTQLTSCLLGLATLASSRQLIKRASLQQVTGFGANTSGTKMFIYVPNNLATNPAIIVAVHYCTGTAQAYYSGSPYAQLSEQYGFIVIYPESPYSGGCWDVSSTAALTHNGGADSNSIANMVTYTIGRYNADAKRVFVTGTSSGAMMTNVLCATYPDIFAAGIAYAGVPAGCFYTGTVNGWNSTCAQGNSIASQAAWAQTALNMYPGYSGPRPRMQIYHGSVDSTLYPQNYNETIKQWTGVFGYSLTPQQVLPNTPASPFTRYVYGANLQGMYGAGVGHSVPIFGTEDLKWFGIIGSGGTTTQAPGPTSTRSATTPGTTTPSTGLAERWGQCGGNGWTGPTQCVSPWTCQKQNDWYSQCL